MQVPLSIYPPLPYPTPPPSHRRALAPLRLRARIRVAFRPPGTRTPMDIHSKALLAVVALVLLATLAVTVVLAVRLFRARRFLRDAGIPLQNKLAFWGALIYTISPVDLLPDPVYLDDIGVLLLALRSLERAARRGAPRKPGHPAGKAGKDATVRPGW